MSWALTMLAMACDGFDGTGASSGVPGSTRLPNLTPPERDLLCAYLHREFPIRTISCPDGDLTTIGYSSIGECIQSLPVLPSCTATVDQLETCIEGLAAVTDAEWCGELGPLPSACGLLADPSCTGGSP